jgi:spore germination protein YaaH
MRPGDGSLRTIAEKGEFETGYRWLTSPELSDLLNTGKHANTLTLIMFENDAVSALMASDAAQQKLVQSVDAALLAYPFTGINIDIEYTGVISDTLREQCSRMIRTFSTQLRQRHPGIHLSVDTYASMSNDRSYWDLRVLRETMDHVIVMAYDFHRRSSIVAGPVAPVFGGKKLWDSDITSHLREYLEVIPAEKILLGVPFYGYEWQTVTHNPQALTFPNTGQTASIERVHELVKDPTLKDVQQLWNEDALAPYITYTQNGENWVLYYENARSISYKLDLVNQLSLGGVAIWALGYEGPDRELWDVIGRKMK